jgi:hypothetical protein
VVAVASATSVALASSTVAETNIDALVLASSNPSTSPPPLPPPPTIVYHQSLYSRVVIRTAELHYDAVAAHISALDTIPVIELAAAVQLMAEKCGLNFDAELELATVFGTVFLASERGQRHAHGLTAFEVAVIHLYTQESQIYLELNGALGGWGDLGPDAVPSFLPYARLLTVALRKLPRIELIGYRGVYLSLEAMLNGRGVGDVLVWNATTSCSLSPDVLQNPAFLGFDPDNQEAGDRLVFVIKLKSGVKIEHFSDKGSASEYYMAPAGVFEQNEEEALVEPGACFRIDLITPMANNITEIRMHQVDRTNEILAEYQQAHGKEPLAIPPPALMPRLAETVETDADANVTAAAAGDNQKAGTVYGELFSAAVAHTLPKSSTDSTGAATVVYANNLFGSEPKATHTNTIEEVENSIVDGKNDAGEGDGKNHAGEGDAAVHPQLVFGGSASVSLEGATVSESETDVVGEEIIGPSDGTKSNSNRNQEFNLRYKPRGRSGSTVALLDDDEND